MCGLVGWISGEKHLDASDRRKFIDMALVLDTIRGGDSTGVFVVKNSWTQGVAPYADWRKQLSGGHEFITSPEYRELFNTGKAADYKYCVGHNRSATVGGVVIDAAHPFSEGPITLVHNGTVRKNHTSEKELANDSHEICWRLSKESPEDVIKSLEGAFALIWHDARDDSLNFVRNSQRPLHMAKASGRDTIYFSSEAELLFWVDKKLHLRLQDIVSLKPAHLVKFSPEKLMVPEVKPVELHSPKASAVYTQRDWSGTGVSTSGTAHRPQNQSWSYGTKSHKPTQKRFKRMLAEHPEHLQEALLDYDLYIDQPEEFVPVEEDKVTWNSQAMASVTGWIMPPNGKAPLPAIVHGLTGNTFTQCGGRVWTVLPLGIRKLTWALPVVVCRLKSTLDITNQIRSIPAEEKPPKLDPTEVSIGVRNVYPKKSEPAGEGKEDDVEVEYPGPGNRMLTSKEWYSATAHGCAMCEIPLTLSMDAWSLEWINTDTGARPVCSTCVAAQAKGVQ